MREHGQLPLLLDQVEVAHIRVDSGRDADGELVHHLTTVTRVEWNKKRSATWPLSVGFVEESPR